MTDRTHHCAGCKERQDRIDQLEAHMARIRQELRKNKPDIDKAWAQANEALARTTGGV